MYAFGGRPQHRYWVLDGFLTLLCFLIDHGNGMTRAFIETDAAALAVIVVDDVTEIVAVAVSNGHVRAKD